MRPNSIVYSAFCVSFPLLFTKLDNYGEYEAGWPAPKHTASECSDLKEKFGDLGVEAGQRESGRR